MIEEIAYRINKMCFLDSNRPVLVGVSGGPDSICLLQIMHTLGYPLVAVYFNHQLRPEADQEAESIFRFSQSLGIQASVGVGDVKRLVQQHSISIEEAARILRYEFLFDQASRLGAQAVAVGHTADDQVETVLLHLIRGCGLRGLVGMQYRSLPNAWSNGIPLVRPLLSTWREEIVAYNQQHKLSCSIDQSNFDTIYLRNRIRLELLPLLKTYNPGIRRLIWQMADIVHADLDVLDSEGERAWERVVHNTGSGYVGIKRKLFNYESKGLQRRIIQKAMSLVRAGLRDLDYSTIQRVIQHITSMQLSSKIELIAGLHCSLADEIAWISDREKPTDSDQWPKLVLESSHVLDVPGETSMEGDWSISCDLMELDASNVNMANSEEDPYQGFLDKDRVKLPLCIRTRLPGDRFKPFGMEDHSQKVADIMINKKHPVNLRKKWPLISSAEEIIWIPGYRIANPYRITAETKNIIHIKINIPS